MTDYKLDFTKLTIADALPVLSSSPSIADILVLSHKIIEGGIYHLPINEINPILQQVSTELPIWMASFEFSKWVKTS